jgi:EpsI family protein
MSKVQLHAYALIVLLLLITGGIRSVKPFRMEGPNGTNFSKIPLHFGEWTGEESSFDKMTRTALPNASLLFRYYRRDYDVAPLGLAIVYGTDLGDFHQPEVCLEGQGLQAVSKGIVKVSDGKGGTFEAISMITEQDYTRQAFLFWFNTDGMTSTSLGRYKVKMLMDRMLLRRIRASAMVRLNTPVVTSEEDATASLVRFAGDVYPYLSKEFEADRTAQSAVGK